MNYYVHDAEGNIVSAGNCQPENMWRLGGPGLTVVQGEADPLRNYVEDGLLKTYDEDAIALRNAIPGVGFRWTLGQWYDERNLPQAKADAWTAVKKARDAAEFSTFEYNDWVFDADQKSQMRIQGAVQMARFDPDYMVDWTLGDNTVVTLDAEMMIGVADALALHVRDVYTKARILRQAINDASSKEALASIHW